MQVVDLADSIAYNAHDVDDAIKLGLITLNQLKGLSLVRRADQCTSGMPHSSNDRAARQALVHSLIDVQVADLLEQATEVLHDVVQLDSLSVRQLGIQLDFSPLVAGERIELQQFLFDNVYRHPQLVAVRKSSRNASTCALSTFARRPARIAAPLRRPRAASWIRVAVGD